jgi:hypothetical protein
MGQIHEVEGMFYDEMPQELRTDRDAQVVTRQMKMDRRKHRIMAHLTTKEATQKYLDDMKKGDSQEGRGSPVASAAEESPQRYPSGDKSPRGSSPADDDVFDVRYEPIDRETVGFIDSFSEGGEADDNGRTETRTDVTRPAGEVKRQGGESESTMAATEKSADSGASGQTQKGQAERSQDPEASNKSKRPNSVTAAPAGSGRDLEKGATMTEPDAGRETEADRLAYWAERLVKLRHEQDEAWAGAVAQMTVALTDPRRALASEQESLWSCPECAFTFDAKHENVNGSGLSCPECEGIKFRDELQWLREERDGYKGYWCGFATWAQEYLDAGRWAGYSLSDAIQVELSERDDQLTDLKRRVRLAIVKCPDCGGTGAKTHDPDGVPNYGPCSRCHVKGYVLEADRSQLAVLLAELEE